MVDKALKPLFEDASVWFEGVREQYEMAFGPFGEVMSLSKDGVVFRRWEACANDPEWFANIVNDFDGLVAEHNELTGDSVQVVADKEEAIECGETATWKVVEDTSVYVYEWVPFEHSAEARTGLTIELDRIMDRTPDWSELFEATVDVAEREEA